MFKVTKIFKDSAESVVKPLSIFETPLTNCSIENSRYVSYLPTQVVKTQGVIQFIVGADSLSYVDLKRSKLYIRAHIEDSKGSKPPAVGRDENKDNVLDVLEKDDTAIPINHLLQSMWEGIEVRLGKLNLTEPSAFYPYTSYIKTLLYKCKTPNDVEKMSTELFYPDENFDSFGVPTTGDEALDWRRSKVDNGKSFELFGPLNVDVFDVEKYLINGVPLSIKLYPHRSTFTLMTEEVEKGYKIVIDQAILQVRFVDVTATMIDAHDRALEKGDALYYYTKTHITPISLKSDTRTFNEANCFNGKVPRKIVVCFVSDESFSGSYTSNAFNMRHYDIESLQVMVNGVSVPHEGYTMDFSANQYAVPAQSLLESEKSAILNYDNFAKGYAFFHYDLRNNELFKNVDDKTFELSMVGEVSIRGRFKTKLPHNVQMLVYGEFQELYRIDRARVVTSSI